MLSAAVKKRIAVSTSLIKNQSGRLLNAALMSAASGRQAAWLASASTRLHNLRSSIPGSLSATLQRPFATEVSSSKDITEQTRQTAPQRQYHHSSSIRSTRLPIVLCHGLFGFDKIGPESIPRLQMHYWGGIAQLLREHDAEVFIARVPSVGSIESRAAELHRFLEKHLGGRDINLVAHSMGGLDARYLISHGPRASYSVRSLTTIATPHRGSPLMDWFRDTFGVGLTDQDRSTLPPALAMLVKALDAPAYAHLTTGFLSQQFNPSTPNDPRVHYLSYGGSIQAPSIFSPMRFSYDLVKGKEGANDGIVSTTSARWGEYVQTVPADHFRLNKVRRERARIPALQLSPVTPSFQDASGSALQWPSSAQSEMSDPPYRAFLKAMMNHHGPHVHDEYLYGLEPSDNYSGKFSQHQESSSFDTGRFYLDVMTRLYRDGL